MSEENLLEQNLLEQTTEDAEIRIPEKFMDRETGELRVEALLKSYLALEKKLSEMLPSPKSDEDKIRLLKALGLPDTADEYEVDVSHGLFTIDTDLNTKLHGLGFTRDQVQAVYDLAAEKFVPLVLEMAAEFQADREIERLVEQFGGEDKWREVSRQLLAFGSKNFPENVFKGLASSYEGVMALYNMMQAGGEPALKTGKAAIAGGVNEESLRRMMQDPRYWRERNPAFIAEVAKGFEQLYGANK
ncbi:MAG: hypothetical protein GC136_00025 [Alphaproteobacteria bacterium]|nr:hypothetical protein [Alphaproteobacteria bacterium]